ncbi:unnamed protein product, partial [Ectocarpus fasciculatus]
MTVHETLKFAFDSMAGGTHAEGLGEEDGLTDDQKGLISPHMMFLLSTANIFHIFDQVEMVIRQLGLLNAKDTIVGDNSLRGVSGGERRRVTLGE